MADWTGNLEWGAKQAQGGCQTTGHLDYVGNVQSGLTGEFHCSPPVPVDTRIEGNRAVPGAPDAADLPADTVAQAGLTGRWQRLTTSTAKAGSSFPSPSPAAGLTARSQLGAAWIRPDEPLAVVRVAGTERGQWQTCRRVMKEPVGPAGKIGSWSTR
ncbi:hypothetical protein ACFRAO_07635 [Streptomyces sp. NPDC056656]|uniref:hypothetical protein n=1 Tax=Streptomyces sp. NPDC056656 TaxID=3345895 RepID=UPI0036CC962B